MRTAFVTLLEHNMTTAIRTCGERKVLDGTCRACRQTEGLVTTGTERAPSTHTAESPYGVPAGIGYEPVVRCPAWPGIPPPFPTAWPPGPNGPALPCDNGALLLGPAVPRQIK